MALSADKYIEVICVVPMKVSQYQSERYAVMIVSGQQSLIEELAKIQEAMELESTLTAADLTANLCFEGIPNFSQLPKGSPAMFSIGCNTHG